MKNINTPVFSLLSHDHLVIVVNMSEIRNVKLGEMTLVELEEMTKLLEVSNITEMIKILSGE